MSLILSLYRRLLARTQFYHLNLHLYKLALRGLGVLNSEGSEVTGEAWLLSRLRDRGLLATVLDVGANTGTYSQEILELAPQANIVACEPHPKTFALLKKNLGTKYKRTLSTQQVKLLNLGLSHKKGRARLWDFAKTAPLKPTQPTSTLSSLNRSVIEELHRQPAQAYSVKLETVDAILKQVGWSQLDLLKIDTEGFELHVLQGAEKAIKQRRIKVVQLEFNEMQVYTKTFVRDVMQALPGYIWYRLLPYNHGLVKLGPYRPVTHELFGFQNLVAVLPTLADQVA
jgi:FkbM family methyltransferase